MIEVLDKFKFLSLEFLSRHTSDTWFQLFVIILFIVLITFLIDFFLVRSFLGFKYRLFVAPGVIVHELSHALLCLLTGAKISKISFFGKEGGNVTHSSAKLPILGSILISLAPLIVGILIIILLSSILGPRAEVFDRNLFFSVNGILHQSFLTLSKFDYSLVRNWFVLYIMLSIIVTMIPSKQDIKNIALVLILISLISYFVITYTSFSFKFSFLPVEGILVFLSVALVSLILLLFLSIIIWMVSKFFSL